MTREKEKEIELQRKNMAKGETERKKTERKKKIKKERDHVDLVFSGCNKLKTSGDDPGMSVQLERVVTMLSG